MISVRQAAVNIILDVLQGRSLNECLPEKINAFSDSRDGAFLKALVFETCRWYFFLDGLVKQLLSRPLKAKDRDIHVLLIVGLCQLVILDIPTHAAVSETVLGCVGLKKSWAKNVVNAVLRNFLRRKEILLSDMQNNDVTKYAHPEWLIKKIQQDWPQEMHTILMANNQHPPMTVRVNGQKISRDIYLQQLHNGIASTVVPTAIQLTTPVNVDDLPGFKNGLVSVQDAAAQLAAFLLAPLPGEKVLDACAAPGGKTAHLLEFQPKIAKLIAVDRDATRLARVKENFKRLQLACTLVTADVSELESWWDGELFDRILLDAPCSASGVIRRHPDIRLLRRLDDIPMLAKTQLYLLQALWPTLKIGGRLLYATCSVFREENENVISTFLSQEKTASEIKLNLPFSKDCKAGKQILPGELGMDGFYYACLEKIICV